MEEKEKIKETEEANEIVDPNEPTGDHYYFPWKGFIIVFGILITLIIVCVVVILCNGGFYQW